MPAPRPHPLTDTGAARQTRRRQRLQMVRMVFISYVIDCGLLLAMSLAGGLALHVPLLYLGAGGLVSALFYVLLASGWSERFSDHYLAGPQMMAHAVVNLGFTWFAPEVGVLMMMVLFILFAFGALRVEARRVMSTPLLASGLVGLGVIVTIVVMGDRLGMPTETWVERVVCGLWVAFVLARSTMVGIYSARLRSLLNKRNEELATTFDKLEQLATRDELTGTLNRRSVMRLLDEERQRMERTGQPFGVALFDLDHFKQVNDGFGHLTGDETLRHFTRTASANMRTTDRLGRYGGEEFLLLLTATTDETAARTAAERVRESTAEHNWSDVAPGLKVTVSAGVALCRPGETAEQLLDRADQALYEAKRNGRNRVNLAAEAPASVG
ncbi:MAG: GGDEF domain-containing protein [Rhizobacter sp.]